MLKELTTIFRSDTYKQKVFSVELVDNSLYHWNVILMSVCPDSLLHQDLIRLKQDGGKDGIHMSITFKDTYPFDPPFIQVTYPAIRGNSEIVTVFDKYFIIIFDLQVVMYWKLAHYVWSY